MTAALQINDIVSFKSKSPSDPTEYYGKIISFCNFELAKRYGDLLAYNNNVRTVDSEVPEVDDCEYMIVKLLETSTDNQKYLIAFAKEWILESSLKIINQFSRIDLTVYEATSENDGIAILSALKAAGYSAKITKSY